MKKVLLLGDSIRMGYDDLVKEELTEFDVYYDPEDNGRFSAYTIWQFNFLNNKYGPFDIVHFNTGYWDMNQEGPNGEEQTPIEDYLHNLERLVNLIKESGATPIFALTIPIFDIDEDKDGFAKTNYKNEWVNKYNKNATKLMNDLGVKINDLYSVLLDGYHYYKCTDSLHLTFEGYEKLAKQVSKTIRELQMH